MSFIEVKDVSKTFKISKRRSGVPGMLANLFVPKFEKKEAVKDISFMCSHHSVDRIGNE